MVFAIVGSLLVGFVASKVVDLHGDAPGSGTAIAVAGAVVAGVLHAVIGGGGLVPWDAWGLLSAAAGAAAGVVAWHGVRSRFVSREPYTARKSY